MPIIGCILGILPRARVRARVRAHVCARCRAGARVGLIQNDPLILAPKSPHLGSKPPMSVINRSYVKSEGRAYRGTPIDISRIHGIWVIHQTHERHHSLRVEGTP